MAAPDLREVFELRAWALALLFAAGELELQTAVDRLQEAADRYGIDPDTAQAIMATEFKAARC
jgi:soluble lytic murein transglycosylase-like protein